MKRTRHKNGRPGNNWKESVANGVQLVMGNECHAVVCKLLDVSG